MGVQSTDSVNQSSDNQKPSYAYPDNKNAPEYSREAASCEKPDNYNNV